MPGRAILTAGVPDLGNTPRPALPKPSPICQRRTQGGLADSRFSASLFRSNPLIYQLPDFLGSPFWGANNRTPTLFNPRGKRGPLTGRRHLGPLPSCFPAGLKAQKLPFWAVKIVLGRQPPARLPTRPARRVSSPGPRLLGHFRMR